VFWVVVSGGWSILGRCLVFQRLELREHWNFKAPSTSPIGESARTQTFRPANKAGHIPPIYITVLSVKIVFSLYRSLPPSIKVLIVDSKSVIFGTQGMSHVRT